MRKKIRKARASDIQAVCEVYENIHIEQEKGTIYTGWVRGVYPTKETAEAALIRGDLFVEEADGKIVGTAIINQIQGDVYEQAAWTSPIPKQQVMVLHTLAIDPYVKGKGYGSDFVDYYEQYAIEHACRCLRMDTNEKNVIARNFYKQRKYQEVDILPCVFNGIPDVHLIMLEKYLER